MENLNNDNIHLKCKILGECHYYSFLVSIWWDDNFGVCMVLKVN